MPNTCKRSVPLLTEVSYHPSQLAYSARGLKDERHSDRLEQSASKVGQVDQQLRRSYDANVKIMVINATVRENLTMVLKAAASNRLTGECVTT